MTFYKTAIIGIILASTFFSVIAQDNNTKTSVDLQQVRNEVKTALSYGNLSQVLEVMRQLPREKRVLFFSLRIETNATGKVEKVDFTNRSKIIDSIPFYQKVTKYLKDDQNKVFKKHKNSIYIIPALLRSEDNYTIEITQDFLTNFENIVPSISSSKIKSLAILPALNFSLRIQN